MSEIFYEIVYNFYTPGHIILICLTFFGLIGTIGFFGRKKLINPVLFVGSIATLALTVALLIYSVVTGEYNLEWYLPLHICNLFVIVYPLALIFKGKVREFLKDYIVLAGFLGCVLAVVFPMTTMYYYPAGHIVSLLVWSYHLLIGAIALYMVFSGNYTKYRCWNALSIITVLIVAATFVNQKLNTNFVFLNPNWNRFPLNGFYLAFGKYGVYVGFGLIYLIAIVFQVVVFVYEKIKVNSLVQICKKLGIIDYIIDNNVAESIKQSSLYKFIVSTETVKNKNNLINRFVTAIIKSDIITIAANTNLENLFDIENFKKIVLKSKVLANINDVISYRELKKIETQLIKAEAAAA